MTYTCPMHPEVQQTKPGNCPKCGMALFATNITATPKGDTIQAKRDNYRPLIVVVSLITLAALITAASVEQFVLHFMTGFFLVFAGFKLMDVAGFAKGYAEYDLLAKRWKLYGYVYPYIELAFGLSMLAGYHPDWLLWIEFGLMVFSGIGVSIKIAKREKFQCACLGTVLKVPLTYVTVIEDFGMAALALYLLFI